MSADEEYDEERREHGRSEPPPAAPGESAHPALALANTAITLPGGRALDLLAVPAEAEDWLAAHGLAPAGIGVREQCATQLRALREHVRSLLAARVDGLPPHRSALAAVNDAMTRAPAVPLLYWDPERGLHRAAPHPVDAALDHALAALATDAADLLAGPDADRLAACASPPCNRFLLQHGRRRHWCSTRCGDRARAARAYARRTGPAA
ncbi:ABATE domain-containing protein [Streptomyces sp. NPDC006684]|uniref:CGNR zinc finger domain-containing protein n=2 Tax=Streptomyces TaxID=1883 RepID=UPI0034549C54